MSNQYVLPSGGSRRCVVNNCLEQGVVDLSLVEAAQQEHDGLTDALNEAFGASEGSQQINEPVARQKLSETHHVQKPLKM